MVQVYWNYREYQIQKQNLISRVQLSLDNSVEAYFADIAKSGFKSYIIKTSTNTDSIVLKTDSKFSFTKTIDSTSHISAFIGKDKPVIVTGYHKKALFKIDTDGQIISKTIDSLISKAAISIFRDVLDLKKLDSFVVNEFKRNKINVKYALKYDYAPNMLKSDGKQKTIGYNLIDFPEEHLKTISKSTFLPNKSTLKLFFTNETSILLKNSFISIFLSFTLSISIILSLLYLLKTIYKQKQLAEMKNDLISNITHEFKTPIATIGVAIESIKNFNVIDDKEKTKNYLDVSNEQLSKLNIMVEKLLETASLDSDSLILNKEEINISDLLDTIANKHKLQTENKTINLFLPKETILAKVDVFHFENAINNVLDNAIKYGGDTINIGLSQNNIAFTVSISDNGNTLIKVNKDKIFEKFYRVPKGNTHDIKGFGIGLYYTKKIIEKHNGVIHLDLGNKKTTFKISLPNE